MAIISLAGAFSAPKRRPKRYHAKDAPYSTGGNRGYYIASLPRPYPKNLPQRIITKLASMCKITRGMGKKDLMSAMKDCVTSDKYAEAKKAV